MHHLERGGMDGVAAKIPEKIAMLLQYQNVDATARQQQTEHHAGRSATGNAAGDLDPLGRHGVPPVGTGAGLLPPAPARRLGYRGRQRPGAIAIPQAATPPEEPLQSFTVSSVCC